MQPARRPSTGAARTRSSSRRRRASSPWSSAPRTSIGTIATSPRKRAAPPCCDCGPRSGTRIDHQAPTQVLAPPMAEALSPAAEHKPYVPDDARIAEFTPKSVIVGAFFGLLFGASTVYLALKAGLTVSASIPIAVLSISLLKRLGGSNIPENHIVPTIGSARGSSPGGVRVSPPCFLS